VQEKGSLTAGVVSIALAGSIGCEPGPRATAVALGAAHTCALDDEHRVWCWGIGGAVEPELVDGLPDVEAISAGQGHICAVASDGTAWCWGDGERGQLGHGSATSSAAPVEVAGLGNVSEIAAGDLHACAVHDGGTLSCWGDNTAGQLGVAPFEEPQTTPVDTLDGAVDVSTGGVDGVGRSCAIRDDGEVWCWGRFSPEPAPVGIGPAKDLDVGADHLCAILTDGTLACVEAFYDDAIASLSDERFESVSAGGLHTCLLTTQGQVWCFGDDLDGQLGDGTGDATGRAVLAIEGDASAVDAGALHSCAVLDTGAIRCWGENNNGRLGNGNAGGIEPSPVDVAEFGD
jgi:alpha-tubulin suppressor-like RCC1 family protein